MEALAEHAIEMGASGLISTGTAGALAPNLTPGMLLLPKRIRRIDGHTFRIDSNWHAGVLAALRPQLPVSTGDLLHVPAVIRDPDQKQALHEQTRAISADMESSHLAAVAARVGVPFLVMRVVMDMADDEIPEAALAAVTAAGDADPMALLRALLRRPADLPGLFRVVRRFRCAADTLRRACRVADRPLLSPDLKTSVIMPRKWESR